MAMSPQNVCVFFLLRKHMRRSEIAICTRIKDRGKTALTLLDNNFSV
jgi:hypothetical protein